MIDNKYLSLVKIVELGSYTKAAEALSLSQPAVTMHIKQLEEEFAIKIFDRTRGHVSLSKEGELLLRYIHRMMALENDLIRAMNHEKNRVRSLNVGITHTAESSAIIEALAAFVRSIDAVNLKIITNTGERLLSMLQNYELDFAFVEQQLSADKIRYATLGSDYLVLALAPDHPLAKRGRISLKELKQERMILRLPDSGTRNLFVANLESIGESISDFNIVIEIDSVATIKDLIRRQFGVSVLARSACLDEYKKGKLALLPIEGLSMERSTHIACREDFEYPEIIDGIVQTYHEMQGA